MICASDADEVQELSFGSLCGNENFSGLILVHKSEPDFDGQESETRE